jgi:hypothetical protein
MNAAQAICMAQENGVRVEVAGADLILDADQEPASKVLDDLRRHKAGIIALLTATESDWTAEDWQVFYDERAGIAEFDGGLPRPEAEDRAYECCIVEWLNRHMERSDPGYCAWCGQLEEESDCVIVPFGTESHGHTWLHHHCWQPWSQKRLEEAEQALTALGLGPKINIDVKRRN